MTKISKLGAVLLAVFASACSSTRELVAVPGDGSVAAPPPLAESRAEARAPVAVGPAIRRTPAVGLSMADEDPFPRWGISGGGAFIGTFDTTLRISSEALGGGTEFSLENDLGFKSETTVARFDAFWRISKRNRLELSWFDIQRDATKTLERDLQIGDTLFPAGTFVTAFLDTQIIKLSYAFNFFARETWELGASLGIHTTDFGTGFRSSVGSLNEEFEVVAPLPLLGLRFEKVWKNRYRLSAWGQALYVKLDTSSENLDFEGYVIDNVVKGEVSITPSVAVGIGYNGFLMDVSLNDGGNEIGAQYGYNGFLFFLTIFG